MESLDIYELAVSLEERKKKNEKNILNNFYCNINFL